MLMETPSSELHQIGFGVVMEILWQAIVAAL
jgi:hypothetical protein